MNNFSSQACVIIGACLESANMYGTITPACHDMPIPCCGGHFDYEDKMTKQIQLTKGQVAIVDDKWFEDLNRYKWCASYIPRMKSYYAVRGSGHGKKLILMHRVITNAPDGTKVDHKNRNTLYNLEENLRVCTNSQNLTNRGAQINNISGYKGVSSSLEKWYARIKIGEKQVYLGTFETAELAARAYDAAAKQNFGEFAGLNFPAERL